MYYKKQRCVVASLIVAMLKISTRLLYIYLLNKAKQLDMSESLYKAISNYLINKNIKQLDLLNGHLITDIVILDINIFCF